MKRENPGATNDCSSASPMHIVFVYGTLRKGQGNSHLLDRSKFLGRAKTKEKFALYTKGIPFLSRMKAVSQAVGEVYAVDDATLERLDQLENHPNWYCREEAEILLEENGKVMTAWIYFCDVEEGRMELIASGDFLRRRSEGRIVNAG